MKPRITLPAVGWSPKKFQMVMQDVRQLLAESGVAPLSLVIEDMDAEPPPAPTYLHLKCTGCGAQWYNGMFTACLNCGLKATVHKATIKRVPLPEGIPLAAILQTAEE